MATRDKLIADVSSLFAQKEIASLFNAIHKDDKGDKHEHIVKDVFEEIEKSVTLKKLYDDLCKKYNKPTYQPVNQRIVIQARKELASRISGTVKTSVRTYISDRKSLITAYTTLIII